MAKGQLAYYETLHGGLIPCRVDKVTLECDRQSGRVVGRVVHFTFTADRGHYKRGDKLTSGERHVVPRTAVRRYRGRVWPVILTYSWDHMLNNADWHKLTIDA